MNSLNWKDGAAKILQHKQSEHHREAHDELYVLPRQVRDVSKYLDSKHASNKAENSKILLTILQ